MIPLFRRSALIVFLLAASGMVQAQTEPAAGRFLAVTGQVNVLGRDGATRTAERGSELRAGETVTTADNALAQMRMNDSSLLSLRGGSEFKLEEYRYAGPNDSSASFVMSVLKGGFRTITGLIARANRPGYRITTPSATIGVRGTHFEVVHVLPQIASQGAPAGTYNRVYEGITTLQIPAGAQLAVSREQTAFAGLQGGAPVLVAPPAAIFGRPTPVPRAAVPAPQAPTRAEGQGPGRAEGQGPATTPGLRTGAPVVRDGAPVLRDGAPTLRTTPIETTTTPLRSLDPSTTTSIIAPTTTLQQPTTTLTPLEPTTTLRTLDPSTTTISPTTTTILQSPTTTTLTPIAPTTTIAPSTTIAPTTIIAPTTTIQTAPATILQQPSTTIKQQINVAPIITR